MTVSYLAETLNALFPALNLPTGVFRVMALELDFLSSLLLLLVVGTDKCLHLQIISVSLGVLQTGPPQ